MKNLFKPFVTLTACMLLIIGITRAQAPQAITYQAQARDNSGNPIINQNISLRFSIHDLTAVGTVVYKETQSTTTSSIGLFNVNIGQGTILIGTFSSINWGGGSKFIQVEMDATGGVSYVNMGTQQMLSVPYALYSQSSSGSWSLLGNSGTFDGTNFIGTTDNVPLSFKVFNQKAGKIDNVLLNSFYGFQSGNANTTGNSNSSIGYQSLLLNTTGDQNTAFGAGALLNNVAGDFAVAIGYRSQYYANNTVSAFNNWNTSIGWQSLRGSTTPANNTGTFNTAVGAQALLNNSTGTYNTGTGYGALSLNTTGSFNTANGYQVLLNNLGNNNTGTGYNALTANTTGIYNAAFGDDALKNNSTGTNNTALGTNTLPLTTVSNYNTAVGASAGAIRNNGGFNTFVGHAAYATADGFSNSTCIGDNASMTASNQVRIGNGSVNSIGGQVGWTTLSDARFKRNVKNNVHGLDFILQLKPVTYNIDVAGIYRFVGKDLATIGKDAADSETQSKTILQSAEEKGKIVYSGFLAQDVEELAKRIGYDFSGVDAPKNENDYYGLRYAEFVVPLVKAIQEQQALIEDQKKSIAEVKWQNEQLKADNGAFKSDIEKIKAQLGMEIKAEK